MKKFYAFCAASLIALSASAQQWQMCPTPKALYNPATQTVSAPKKATSLEGTIVWGYYTKDGEDFLADIQSNRVGLVGTGDAGTVECGYYVKVAGTILENSSIQAVRIAMPEAAVVKSGSVKIYDKNQKLKVTKAITVGALKDCAYTDVMLSDPFTLTDDCYIALSVTTSGYTDGARYPIFIDKTQSVAGSMYIIQSGKFYDYSSQFGPLVFQLALSDCEIPAHGLSFGTTSGYTEVNKEYTIDLPLSSSSSVATTSIDYTVSVAGGEPVEHHAEVALPAGFNVEGTLPVTFTAPAEAGNYTVDVQLTKVNGEDNALADKVASSSFVNVDRWIDRNCVMEEFTGTGCGWCPRGMAGMDICRRYLGDRFIGIAYHLFNSTDPMYATGVPNLGWSGAPSCTLDRSGAEMDPYYGSGDIILDDINARLKLPGLVDLSGTTAELSEDLKKVTVNASIDAVSAGTYELVYVLLCDSLAGSTFKQSNYYASYALSQVGAYDEEDMIRKFVKGGEWGTSSPLVVYDDVAIASSYVSQVSKGGKVTLAKDEKQTASYTLTLPTKAVLKNAVQNSWKLSAAVLAVGSNGEVANAIRVKINNIDEAAGIQNVVANTEVKEVARYSLDGRRVSANTPGVQVVRLSDGTSYKEFVK